MKLDKRMQAIFNLIPNNCNLIDIGADHGYISINYALNNKNNCILATDISEKSLQKAKNLSSNLKLTNYNTQVADGLKGVETAKYNAVLIAGMGGLEIINILKDNLHFDYYILSPQKNVDCVREFLSQNNVLPEKDFKVQKGKLFYDVIFAKNGEYNPTKKQLMYGNCTGSDFENFLIFEKKRLNSLLLKVGEKEKNDILHKLEVLDNVD